MQFAYKKIKFGGSLPRWYLFWAGVFLGIIVVNLKKETLLENTVLLDKDSLYQMKYMTVDSNVFFWYVCGARLKALLILAVLATTYLGLAAVCGAAVWYGAAAGMFITIVMARYGVKGILLVIMSFFPHFLLYAPAFFFLLAWCEEICRIIYFEKGARLGSRQLVAGKILQLFGALLVVITGCILESYVNPVIMKKILAIF